MKKRLYTDMNYVYVLIMQVYVMLFTGCTHNLEHIKILFLYALKATKSAHLISIGTLDLALSARSMEDIMGILGQNAND